MKVRAQQAESGDPCHAIETQFGNSGALADEEWDAMDEEIARSFNEGSLIPVETLEEAMRYLPEAIQKLKLAKLL